MTRAPLQSWEQQFRRAAKADKLVALRGHLEALDIEARPQLLLEGTIQVVRACVAYAIIDGQSFARFLAMQTYDPAQSPRAVYIFTFSLSYKAFARVLVGRDLRGLDLAGLYGHPWQRYKRVGYNLLLVSRADRMDFKSRESTRLEQRVFDDLHYDYSEEELEIRVDEAFGEDLRPLGALTFALEDRRDVVNFLRVCRSATANEALARM